jgi:hypothetical protein
MSTSPCTRTVTTYTDTRLCVLPRVHYFQHSEVQM